MIFGVISSRSVQQNAVAALFVNHVQTSSNIRRIQRFFKEQRIDSRSLAQILLEMVVLSYRLDLVIDQTNWKFGNFSINYLILSVLIDDKHRIPLFCTVLPKKGTSNGSEQVVLLQKFIDVFDADWIQSLIGERKFISQQRLSFLYAQRIPFYLRMKKNRLLECGRKRQTSIKNKY